MSSRSLRQYEAIWIKVKETGSVRLHVHPTQAYTVRRMVKKEKDQDLAWKMENETTLRTRVMKYSYDEDKQEMTFKLIDRSAVKFLI